MPAPALPADGDGSTAAKTCCDMIHATDMHARGIDGEGQAVVVIDSELDVEHEVFQQGIENPKYSKTDIENFLHDAGLGTDLNIRKMEVAVNDVYRSEKIPFAFNYADRSKDVYCDIPEVIHGSHVSGIAVGKNDQGSQNGYDFTGVAPETQLIFMCVQDRDGNLSYDAILAAIDDAAKMDVSAVNLSLGSNYASSTEALKTAIENAAKADIFISVSAGNSSRGYHERAVLPENIDYSASGMPADLGSSTAVASVNNTKIRTSYYEMTAADGSQIKYSVSTDTNLFGEAFGAAADSPGAHVDYEYVYCNLGKETDFSDKDLGDKIALIDRGEIDFTVKIQNAKDAGAAGVIIRNTSDDISERFLMGEELPSAVIGKSDGEKLKSAETKTITVGKELIESSSDNPDSGMSSFSSWATNHTLQLKPEITAPGGGIYSSVPDENHNKYESFNGTSMAAPHITGAVTLLKQYIETNYGSGRGINGRSLTMPQEGSKSSFVENLMMSTAEIQYYDNGEKTPYSPRLQGAGLLNLKAASETPVILTGDPDRDGGKTKLSLGELGELEDDKFTIECTARNFSDQDVTYDGVDLSVTTDDVTLGEDGRNYVGGTKNLAIEDYTVVSSADGSGGGSPDTGSNSITVPANGQVTIKVEVTLDTSKIQENKEIFTNGFFVEGFLSLRPSSTDNGNSVPQINIPYSGFCGDWESAPVFDRPNYEGDSELGATFLGSSDGEAGVIGCYQTNVNGMLVDVCTPLGVNLFADGADDAGEKFAGISPNSDGSHDFLCVSVNPLRSVKSLKVEIIDSEDETVFEEEAAEYEFSKFVPFCFDISVKAEESEDGDAVYLPDGDYTAVVTGSLNRGSENDSAGREQSVSMDFYVDRQYPTVSDISAERNSGREFLTFTAHDNKFVMAAYVLDKNLEEELASSPDTALPKIEIQPANTPAARFSFDITDLDKSSLKIYVVDYALNEAAYPVEIGASGSGGGGDDPVRYTIHFDSNGGSDISDMKADRGTLIKEPKEPVREGFIFGGWFTDKACTSAYDFGQKIIGNLTLYAKWKEDPAVSWINPFSDVSEDDWFYEAVRYTAAAGFFSGVTETEFAPQREITRAMLVTLLWRMENRPVVNYLMSFYDVSPDAYYGEAVRWAVSEGIVKGYSDTVFSPDRAVSRQEIAVIFQRYAQYKEMEAEKSGDLNQFADSAQASEWAEEGLSWAIGAGFLSGKGNGRLDPLGNTARAEAAAILQRFSEKEK